jgi:hypothetical protein
MKKSELKAIVRECLNEAYTDSEQDAVDKNEQQYIKSIEQEVNGFLRHLGMTSKVKIERVSDHGTWTAYVKSEVSALAIVAAYRGKCSLEKWHKGGWAVVSR